MRVKTRPTHDIHHAGILARQRSCSRHNYWDQRYSNLAQNLPVLPSDWHFLGPDLHSSYPYSAVQPPPCHLTTIYKPFNSLCSFSQSMPPPYSLLLLYPYASSSLLFSILFFPFKTIYFLSYPILSHPIQNSCLFTASKSNPDFYLDSFNNFITKDKITQPVYEMNLIAFSIQPQGFLHSWIYKKSCQYTESSIQDNATIVSAPLYVTDASLER